MKIIYARTQFWFGLKSGGSVGHTLGVLSGFRSNNCDVKILSNEKFFGIDDYNYCVIEPQIKKHFGEIFYNFYAQKSFKKEIVNYRPDFIYHRYSNYSFFIAKIAKELGIPLILELNSFGTWTTKFWSKNKIKYFLYPLIAWIQKYNIENAALIVVVSDVLKNNLLDIGVPEKKILVNYNGVDPNKFSPDVKSAIDSSKKRIVIGFSGTFGRWHGIPDLVLIIDKILGNGIIKNVNFLLIGNGVLKEYAQEKIGHYNDVDFLEVPYSEVESYLAACDILISPHCPSPDGKEFFGSPTKIFEYMAMGRAIIASDLGQIGKVLEDGKTAILVKPGDIDGFINSIIKLSNDEVMRKYLGSNARQEVIKNYTWRENIKRLLTKIDNDKK